MQPAVIEGEKVQQRLKSTPGSRGSDNPVGH